MKKIVFSLALTAFAAANVLAQACQPDNAYVAQGVGIYPQPDSLDIGTTPNGEFSPLPCAIVGEPYEFTFTAVVPTSYLIGGVNLPIQKVDLLSIANRPPGINYSCNPAGTPALNGTCAFPSSATVGRCVKLSGTPTTAGLYAMTINTKITSSTFVTFQQSFPPVTGNPIQDIKGRYVLPVVATAADLPLRCIRNTQNRTQKGDLSVVVKPNPAHGATVFLVSSKSFTNEGKFVVTDAFGREVANQAITLDGIQNNVIDFDCSQLVNGVYYYTIQANGERVSERFVVQH
jgi:Secretion system C-terminal sorting domain